MQARRDTLRKARTGLANQLERLTQAYLSAVLGLTTRLPGKIESRSQPE
jgi:hypothetical protein